MKLYVVYCVDEDKYQEWSHRVLHGVFTDKDKASKAEERLLEYGQEVIIAEIEANEFDLWGLYL